jgi:hypothetical protein
MGHPDRGNAQVMGFAGDFLEPQGVLGKTSSRLSSTGQLEQPTVTAMSSLLIKITNEAVELYLREEGTDEIAHAHLESLLRTLMTVLDDYTVTVGRGGSRGTTRRRRMEDETAVRRVIACISGEMTRLAERLLETVQEDTPEPQSPSRAWARFSPDQPKYIMVRLCGKKPPRFEESTGLPTFLEFDAPSICRLREDGTASTENYFLSQQICTNFAQPYMNALKKQCGVESVVLRTEAITEPIRADITYLNVFPVEIVGTDAAQLHAKSFYHRKETNGQATIVEMTVAHPFPCSLSRQRSLHTTEMVRQPPTR